VIKDKESSNFSSPKKRLRDEVTEVKTTQTMVDNTPTKSGGFTPAISNKIINEHKGLKISTKAQDVLRFLTSKKNRKSTDLASKCFIKACNKLGIIS